MSSGLGYFDAEGVWRFGEADTETLFSDMLNIGQEATSDQFVIDRARMTSIEGALAVRSFVASSSGARDTHWGTPADATARLALQNLAATTIRTDTGITERYYAGLTDGGSNPFGRAVAGWYPVESQWISWTAAPTNFTIGTGGSASFKQRYKYIGGRIFFDCKYVLGTTGASVGSDVRINIPLSVLVPTRYAVLGVSGLHRPGVSSLDGRARVNVLTANEVQLSSYNGTDAAITATSPWTWAAGHELTAQFWADLP